MLELLDALNLVTVDTCIRKHEAIELNTNVDRMNARLNAYYYEQKIRKK